MKPNRTTTCSEQRVYPTGSRYAVERAIDRAKSGAPWGDDEEAVIAWTPDTDEGKGGEKKDLGGVDPKAA